MNTNRRTFMSASAVAGTAAVAGCLDDLPLVGSDSLPDYADWLSADVLLEEDSVFVMHMDYGELLEWPEDDQEELEVEEIADQMGVETEDIDGFLIVEVPDETGFGGEEHIIFLGSFDPDEAADNLELSDDPEDEYEGYDVYEEMFMQVAIGDDAIVMSTAYEDWIDASTGEADRVADEDGDWDELLREVGNSAFSMLATADADDEAVDDPLDDPANGDLEGLELMGMGMDSAGSDTYEIFGTMYFEDESDAEDAVEEMEEDAEEDDEVEDYSIDQDGLVVTFEMTTDEMDF